MNLAGAVSQTTGCLCIEIENCIGISLHFSRCQAPSAAPTPHDDQQLGTDVRGSAAQNNLPMQASPQFATILKSRKQSQQRKDVYMMPGLLCVTRRYCSKSEVQLSITRCQCLASVRYCSLQSIEVLTMKDGDFSAPRLGASARRRKLISLKEAVHLSTVGGAAAAADLSILSRSAQYVRLSNKACLPQEV